MAIWDTYKDSTAIKLIATSTGGSVQIFSNSASLAAITHLYIDDTEQGTISRTYNMTAGDHEIVIVLNTSTTPTSLCFGLRTVFKELVLGNGITEVGNQSFADCDSITALTVSNSLTRVNGDGLLMRGISTPVHFPATLQRLDNGSTACWHNISEVYIYAPTPPTTGSMCFYEWPAGGTLHIPPGSNYNTWKTQLTNWTIVDDAVEHTFEPSATSYRFEASGGTSQFTVDAETTWTSTPSSYFAVSPTSGNSGTTTVTITASENPMPTKREETLTFTDNDGYSFTFKITQRAPQGAGFSTLFMGDYNLASLHLGESAVTSIYMGETQVFSSGPFVGIKVTPKTLEYPALETSKTIKVKASMDWEIGGLTSWLTADVQSGTSGETVVTITADLNETEEARTNTLSVYPLGEPSSPYKVEIAVSQKRPGGLPEVPFMFNYHSKDVTGDSLVKTPGQLFDNNVTIGNVPKLADGALDFRNGAWYGGWNFGSAAANPFNRDSSHKSFTFIYKTSGFTGSSNNLFANRSNSGTYNYMVRGNMFHTSSSGFLNMTPSQSPQTVVIRINPDGTSERWCVETGQKVTDGNITYGGLNNGIGFFSGYSDMSSEGFGGVLYWMYCSLEALTDAEIQQVIDYNNEYDPA